MKGYGITLIIAGVILGGFAINMDTTFPGIFRYYDPELVKKQGDYLAIAFLLLLGGCIITVRARFEKVQDNGVRHTVKTSTGTLEFGKTTIYICTRNFGTLLIPAEPTKVLISDILNCEILHPKSDLSGELRIWTKDADFDSDPQHVVLFPLQSLQGMKQAVDILKSEGPKLST